MKKSEKNLIISLIKDDIINLKLVSGLNELKLDASAYCLNLSETIFYLLGIEDTPENEEKFKKYHELTKEAAKLDFGENMEVLEEKVREVYEKLIIKM